MSAGLTDLFWPDARLDEAIELAARHAGIDCSGARTNGARSPRGSLALRLEAVARDLRIEIEPLDIACGDLDARLRSEAPFLAVVKNGFAAIVGRRGAKLVLLTPELRTRRVDVAVIARELRREIEAPAREEIERVLEHVELAPARRDAARQALLDERLRTTRVRGLFALRPPANASVRSELLRAGVLGRFVALLFAHAMQYALWLASWWVVGRAALEGLVDPGWFHAWALLLASLIPFRLLATWIQGTFAVAAGGILKQRLLAAALRLDPERIRGLGLGDFVGRVIESEAVESLALGGGIAAVTAIVELTAAVLILAFAPGGALLAVVLVVWSVLALAAGAWCVARRRAWTDERLALSHGLIEKMVGHRTRLVQEPREQWHAGEDAELERYLASSRRMDDALAWLVALAPRGWLFVGVVGIAPSFLGGSASTTVLAAELGGILLGYVATNRLAHGLAQLGGAAIAWKRVVPILEALSREEAAGVASVVAEPAPVAAGQSRERVLQVKDLGYRHPGRSETLFKKLTLDVYEGDRILLEGTSGAGKSTLASLLCGLRAPDEGAVLLRGVDRGTLGVETWRRRVSAAPQFHENHVFSDTFAFNLLMGRSWPPREEDWKRAEELCGELGLADLIARMPAGMNEIVGDSGWQLSHGERSRLFMARALLQESDVVVLDESFAALDPATLESSMRCALRRAKTLVVIAHP
ncbi:MAG: ABC transporter ATP-binding protein/permease [Planctomycetes bacterium]|nr:ABC transporter ATP-binding protein/permease [Planctomycetota bacterium]